MEQRVIIGEFQPFTENVEAAVVTGPYVNRAVGILGTRPPFRDAEEADALDMNDVMEARRMAMDASGAIDVAVETHFTDRTVSAVVFSRTGALALRTANKHGIHDEALDLISALDGSNYIASVLAQRMYVG